MQIKPIAIAIVALGAVAAQANLIQNGSFEDAALPGQGWDLFNAIPGWTATDGHIEVGHGDIYGITGYDGRNVLELDADRNSTVSQSLNLGAGAYSLSFLYAKRAGTSDETNMMDVLWNGAVVASLSPNSTSFTASNLTVMGVAGTNTLSFRAMGTSDSFGGMIDKVGVQAVPAPSSLAAMLVGGVGMLRRRRRA